MAAENLGPLEAAIDLFYGGSDYKHAPQLRKRNREQKGEITDYFPQSKSRDRSVSMASQGGFPSNFAGHGMPRVPLSGRRRYRRFARKPKYARKGRRSRYGSRFRKRRYGRRGYGRKRLSRRFGRRLRKRRVSRWPKSSLAFAVNRLYTTDYSAISNGFTGYKSWSMYACGPTTSQLQSFMTQFGFGATTPMWFHYWKKFLFTNCMPMPMEIEFFIFKIRADWPSTAQTPLAWLQGVLTSYEATGTDSINGQRFENLFSARPSKRIVTLQKVVKKVCPAGETCLFSFKSGPRGYKYDPKTRTLPLITGTTNTYLRGHRFLLLRFSGAIGINKTGDGPPPTYDYAENNVTDGTLSTAITSCLYGRNLHTVQSQYYFDDDNTPVNQDVVIAPVAPAVISVPV